LKEQTAHSPSLSESLKLLQGMWMKVFFLAFTDRFQQDQYVPY
jgi:hypothetical protein